MTTNKYQALIIDDHSELPKNVFLSVIEKIKEKHVLLKPIIIDRPALPESCLNNIDFILLDLKFENSQNNGVWFLGKLREFNQTRKNRHQIPIPVLVYSDFQEIEKYVNAKENFDQDEIFGLIPKAPGTDIDKFALVWSIDRICRWIEKERYFKVIKEGVLNPIQGESESIHEIKENIKKIAPTDSTVLITGESGTGKELIAQAIHQLSNRAGGRFIPLNCSSIPETLLESELFGYEKGAFTGADRRKKGSFEEANAGSIFLDEIGELTKQAQPKLLRVLQENTIMRVGGAKEIPVNVRVIAATNKDLKSEVDNGQFREDLYYRINVFHLTAPPLRDRKEDIELLTNHFMRLHSYKYNKCIKSVSENGINKLKAYHWPGNVRELQNVVERAVVYAESGDILEFDNFLEGKKIKVTSGPISLDIPAGNDALPPTESASSNLLPSVENFLQKLLSDIQERDQNFKPYEIAMQLYQDHLNALPEEQNDRMLLCEKYKEFKWQDEMEKTRWNSLYEQYKKKRGESPKNSLDNIILIAAAIKKILQNNNKKVKIDWHLAFPLGYERRNFSDKIKKFSDKYTNQYSSDIKSFLLPDK